MTQEKKKREKEKPNERREKGKGKREKKVSSYLFPKISQDFYIFFVQQTYSQVLTEYE